MTYAPPGGSAGGRYASPRATPLQMAMAPNRPILRPATVGFTTNTLVAKLPQAELEILQPQLMRVRLVSGQVLIERGQPPEHVFFIEDGIASLMAETEQGKAGVQVGMIGREGVVGSLTLLHSQSAAFASTITQIPGTALRIPVAELRRCFESSPVLHDLCMQFVQSLTRQIMSIAAWNASNTLAKRCVRWLLMAHERIDGDDLPVTHEALSAMLGVRRSGVTVAAAALQRAGLIRTTRGRMRILDRAGLEAFVAVGGQASGHAILAATDRALDGGRPTDDYPLGELSTPELPAHQAPDLEFPADAEEIDRP